MKTLLNNSNYKRKFDKSCLVSFVALLIFFFKEALLLLTSYSKVISAFHEYRHSSQMNCK